MKPNFALGLTDDGITLWQRDSTGWLRVGAAAADAPDLGTQMDGLAKIASALAPEGVRTKLVVPDDMLLVCDLPVAARNHDMQAHEIRAQLAGRTPYPVEELDFDWTAEDGTAHVIVVARETLIEAEDFARSHGFNPVSYVASPANDAFPREPFFGPTRCARELIGDVSALERDHEMLRETGIATLPDPELIPEAPVTGPAQTPEPEADTNAAAIVAEDDAPTQDAPGPDATPETPPEDQTTATPNAAEMRKTALLAKLTAGKAQAGPEDTAEVVARNAPEAVVSLPSGDDTVSQDSDTKAPEEPVSFRSRRASAAEVSALPASPPKPAAKLSKTAIGRALDAAKTMSVAKSLTPKALSGRNKDSGIAKPTTEAPKSIAKVTIGPRKDPLETLRSHGQNKTASEAERMTIFGARENGIQDLSTQRRTLMVLGGVGLLLVAVAVWVAYFTFSADTTQERAQDPTIATPELDLVVAPPLESDPDATTAEDIEAALGLEDAAGQVPLDAPDSELTERLQAQDQQEEDTALDFDTPAGRVAVLRSASLLPPQDIMPLPAAPEAPLPFAEQSLAPLRQDLAALAAQPEPEPLATEEDLAAEPPASLLPEGEDALDIAVTEGTPPVMPPARPEGIAPEPEVTEAAATPEPEPAAAPEPDIAEDAVAEDVPAVDPMDESALVIAVTEGRPAAVPPERPASVLQVPATAPETTPEEEQAPDLPQSSPDEDQAALDTPPPGGVALTSLRPESRPETIIETATAAGTEAEPETIEGSAYAVASSLRPSNRPSQFAAVVQRSMAAAPAAQPAAPARSAAIVAPSPQPQAVPVAAAPSAVQIPSSASVSREATQARAINLRQVNLIGVMGTSASRRALVRLSNGRIVTVRVGETLDGGQVTAIGENELRYSRRGRDVVLRIAS